MIKKLYNSIIRLAGHRLSLPILAIVSFSESIFFPIPPDVMLIPMVIAKRSKAWLYATICTIGSVFGGLAGYFIGLFFFQSIGEPLLDFFGNSNQLSIFKNHYNKYGLLLIFVAGLSPIPYKAFTIISGFIGLPLGIFLLGSVLSRGIRFYLEAGLIWKFGDSIIPKMKANLTKIFIFISIVFCFALFVLYY